MSMLDVLSFKFVLKKEKRAKTNKQTNKQIYDMQ